MACGLALLASGQVFATDFFSATATILDADLANSNKWANGCAGGTPGVPNTPPTSSDKILVCSGHSLNLSSAATVNAGTLTFGLSGTWGGTGLKFGAGNKRIQNYNSSLPTIALNISSMITGNQITITPNNSIVFSSVTGGSLTCTPAGGSAASYTAGTPIAADTTCTVAAAPPPTVSAPIFSTQEKPAVFSEEVK
jgi:hypothetical protein